MAIPVAESHFNRAASAEQHDAVRPRLPAAFLDLLCQYARMERPRLVVDLGCGPGPSAAAWADRAERVIGVEPAAAMVDVARRRAPGPHVEVRQGFGDRTGVPDGAADIVTAVQALHWMEPRATLAEIARILRPGGVFAAADHEGPASVDWEVEAAEHRFIETAVRLRRELGLTYEWPEKWPKAGHLERLRYSGFAYVREVLLHGTEVGSAERRVWGAVSVMVEDIDEFYARGVTPSRSAWPRSVPRPGESSARAAAGSPAGGCGSASRRSAPAIRPTMRGRARAVSGGAAPVPLDAGAQVVERERFAEEGRRRELARPVRRVAGGGDDHDGRVRRREPAVGLGEGVAVHHRHVHVQQDHVGRCGAAGQEQVQRSGAVGGSQDLVPLVLQRHLDEVPDLGVVVDDQHPQGGAARTPGLCHRPNGGVHHGSLIQR